MTISTESAIAAQLRTIAQEIRKEANVREEVKLFKVAQVLSAARALNELQTLFKGRE